MGNHPYEKFPQDNYNEEDTLHSNRLRSELSMAPEKEVNRRDDVVSMLRIDHSYLTDFHILINHFHRV